MNKKTDLKWEEHKDYDGNTYWSSTVFSIWGVNFYRILQKIKNNKIVFYEGSDENYLIDYRYGREVWDSLQDAKYDMNRSYLSRIEYNYDTTRSI